MDRLILNGLYLPRKIHGSSSIVSLPLLEEPTRTWFLFYSSLLSAFYLAFHKNCVPQANDDIKPRYSLTNETD